MSMTGQHVWPARLATCPAGHEAAFSGTVGGYVIDVKIRPVRSSQFEIRRLALPPGSGQFADAH